MQHRIPYTSIPDLCHAIIENTTPRFGIPKSRNTSVTLVVDYFEQPHLSLWVKRVFKFLDAKDIANVQQVSKRFYEVTTGLLHINVTNCWKFVDCGILR